MERLEQLLEKGKTGRHETFTPRYGWIKKGYEKAKNNPHVFNDPNDIEQLGVGKNMVRSIRYWCSVFGILKPSSQGKRGDMTPTEFGEFLLDDRNGRDPFIEDLATLWLLHWKLFRAPYNAVSWPLSFSFCNMSSFDQQQFTDGIIATASRIGNGRLSKISPSSYAKDASCILRMYTPNDGSQSEISSPFEQLELILTGQEPRTYFFNLADKHTLPPLIFLACCFDYADFILPHNLRSLSLSRITYDPASPGVAFKLSETHCGEKIDYAAKEIKGVTFVESNGIRQLQYELSAGELFLECLYQYYQQSM